MTAIARSADRCVTLHWRSESAGASFHVVRSADARGPFAELPNSPVVSPSFADLSVENGQTYFYQVTADGGGESAVIAATPRAFASDDAFLEFLQAAAFDYFWFETDPRSGLVRDRSTPSSPCSIAAVGFGLTALGIGVDHGWITRREAAGRTLLILQTLAALPQSPAPNAAGHKGWFYHFLDLGTLSRYRKCELSSIDTALLFSGVLYAREFFRENDEGEIRSLSDQLFARLDWRWMLNGGEALSMGWHPEKGFIPARWQGYNEGAILYLLGLGAPDGAALDRKHWAAWTATYLWRTNSGFSFIQFPPLFGHQYTACWVDFREIQDDYTRAKDITYFENSRRATLAQRAYAIANPRHFPGYSANLWGFTACDGPGSRGAQGYAARGAPPPENDDGTIAPTAPGSSLPFAPVECLAALRHFYDAYREKLVCGYGFRDAFNPGLDWWDPDVLGIDQGPMLVMIENYRSRRVWEVMRKSAVLQKGLERAGFR